MTKRCIQIAQRRYRLEGMLPSLESFLVQSEEIDGIFRICPRKQAPVLPIVHTYLHDELLVHLLSDGYWMYESPEKFAPAQLIADAAHRELTLYLPPWPDEAAQNMKAMHMLRTAMECRFYHEGVLSLHAAAVSLSGCAVAFTGHSGVGKSTRAERWREALGAEWVSGDRPALRVGQPARLFGVPWDGKEQIFRNASFPLHAVMEVRRAERTALRRLTPGQAKRVLLSQCFIPMWNTEAAAQTLALISKAAAELPMYRLFCGPGAEVARETEDILFHHPEKILEAKEDMKIKKGFVLRNVVGESIIMPTGENIAKFEGAVVLNEVSAFIFGSLSEPLSREDLLAKVLSEFDVDEETAANDLDEVIAQFEALGLMDTEI